MEFLNYLAAPLKSFYESLPSAIQLLIAVAVLLIILVVLIVRTFKKVPQGSRGIRTFLSRPILHYPRGLTKEKLQQLKQEDKEALAIGPVAIHGRPNYSGPGLASMVPFFNGMDIGNIQEKTYKLQAIVVRASDGGWRERYEDARATFRVTNPYFAQYRYANLEEFLTGLVTEAATVILSREALDVVGVRDGLTERINTRCDVLFSGAGLELVQITLGAAEPVRETILAEALKGSVPTDLPARMRGIAAVDAYSTD